MRPLDIALKEIGTKEIVGAQHNPTVVNYFSKVGHSWVKDDETAWCAAFVGYCLEMAGFKSTRRLNARSYLELGTPTTKPQLGDLAIFWRGSKAGWEGHVGFYINEDDDGIRVLGGNQANEVSIIEYPKTRLLGFRKYVETAEEPEPTEVEEKEEEQIKEASNLLAELKSRVLKMMGMK